jgi:UDP-glucose 4-epimerase
MFIKTIIIGKNSNLTNGLLTSLKNVVAISSRKFLEDENILEEYKNKKINLIFNNFQTATQLNILNNTEKYISNSLLVTAKVLDYFKDTQVNKVIYTSSSSVYGNNILCNEKDELKPLNLHASLKVANEKLIEKFCLEHSIDYTIARIFNMYGGEDKFSVINKIIKAYKNQEVLTIVNNGNAIRDFIHIDNVIEIYEKILNKKDIKVINIGTGDGVSIKTIIDFLKNHNKILKINNIFADELKTSTADIRLLYKVFYKKKFISIEEYLKKELSL